MAVATPLTKVFASPFIPVFAALILLPSLSIFLGAGENAPTHRPKRIKIVTCSHVESMWFLHPNPFSPTNLVQEQALANTYAVAQDCEQKLWPDFKKADDSSNSQRVFWAADGFENFCGNIYFNVLLPVYFWRDEIATAFSRPR